MATTAAASTTLTLGALIEESELPATRLFRLGKSFAAVHFLHAGKGRIVFLPEGAEVRIIGPSCVCECFEVMFENHPYSVFTVDLLGPWSMPIKPKPTQPTPAKPTRMKPIGALAMGACV
jgi:hypothetical protein